MFMIRPNRKGIMGLRVARTRKNPNDIDHDLFLQTYEKEQGQMMSRDELV
jgi:hypothetical protein